MDGHSLAQRGYFSLRHGPPWALRKEFLGRVWAPSSRQIVAVQWLCSSPSTDTASVTTDIEVLLSLPEAINRVGKLHG